MALINCGSTSIPTCLIISMSTVCSCCVHWCGCVSTVVMRAPAAALGLRIGGGEEGAQEWTTHV